MRRYLRLVLAAVTLAVTAIYAKQEVELRAVRAARSALCATLKIPETAPLARRTNPAQTAVLVQPAPGFPIAPAVKPRRPARIWMSPAARATSSRRRATELQNAIFQRVREVGKRLADDPALQRAARANDEHQVDKDYAALFKKLDPETASALADLLKKRAGVSVDAALKLNAGGMDSEERQAVWQTAVDAETAIDQQIEQLLGAEGYADYQDYSSSLAERQQVEVFKEKLFSAGLGLAPSQEEALVEWMQAASHAALTPEENPEIYDHSIHLPEERKLKPEEMEYERMLVFHQRFMEGAARFLTPEQMQVYEKYLGELENYWKALGNYLPTSDFESHDRADVAVKKDGSSVKPLTVNAASSLPQQWGDQFGGSSSQVYKTTGNMLGARFEPGSGWGAGITFWPEGVTQNDDQSADAAGATRLVVKLKAPAGVTVRFGMLESGVNWPASGSFNGAKGADGEAFRHPGVKTKSGWQIYSIPLSELKLNGGYGNQTGNRVVDVQAVKGIEILVPGGQPRADMEIEYLRLE